MRGRSRIFLQYHPHEGELMGNVRHRLCLSGAGMRFCLPYLASALAEPRYTVCVMFPKSLAAARSSAGKATQGVAPGPSSPSCLESESPGLDHSSGAPPGLYRRPTASARCQGIDESTASPTTPSLVIRILLRRPTAVRGKGIIPTLGHGSVARAHEQGQDQGNSAASELLRARQAVEGTCILDQAGPPKPATLDDPLRHA